MLCAIGVITVLAGCRTCWIDRDDDRPMKYGSFRDCVSYGWWGECFHPKYHCGAPDGFRDHISVKKAAVKAANQSLSEQDGGCVSRDFKFGYQQAYIDIANGGTGAMPAIPPSRYWAAPYRTTWGHNKARDWFSGYQAGACSAKCCMPADTLSVPTSVYRDCDNRLAIGLDGGSFGAAPIVNANYGGFNGGAISSPNPMTTAPYSMSPAPYSMNPQGNALSFPAMNHQMQFGPPTGVSPSTPMMSPPPMPAPNSESFPGGGWSNAPLPSLPSYPGPSLPSYPAPALPSYPTPTLPSYPGPNTSLPAPAGGGHSPSSPSGPIVNPPVIPMTRQNFAPPAAPQPDFSASNPWGRFRGVNGFGFQSEGATR